MRLMSDISIRSATSADIARIKEIRLQAAYPGHVALMGSIERAQRYSARRVKLDRIPNDARVTVVAEVSDRVVGVLQYTYGSDVTGMWLARLWLLVSLLGPIGLVRRLPFLRARERVKISVPPDAFRMFNLQVDTAHQSRGIGSQLLQWADDEAMRLGATRMALLTDSMSPAIRLYERNGYVTTRTATDVQYERLTHDPGRVLMEKDLDAAHQSTPER
jgi:GNAT superfamily N-acetyltransferase